MKKKLKKARGKATAKAPTKKPYVQNETIWKSTYGLVNELGDKKECKVGKHKLSLAISPKPNANGQAVRVVTYINEDGSAGKTVRDASGSTTKAVRKALERNGVQVKFKNRFPKRKKNLLKITP